MDIGEHVNMAALSSHVEPYVRGGGFRNQQKIENFFIALEFKLWMTT